MSQFSKAGVAVLGMIGFEVVAVELRLEGSCNQFVLRNVWSIELNSADSVSYVGVPPQTVGFEIKDLDVSIVVTSSDASFLLVVGVSEGYRPAVWLDCLLN